MSTDCNHPLCNEEMDAERLSRIQTWEVEQILACAVERGEVVSHGDGTYSWPEEKPAAQ